MEQNLQKIFRDVKYQPEDQLSVDIWDKIEYKINQKTKLKKFGYLSLSVLSLFGSIFSIKGLIEEATRLGFFDYLSLVFSDSGVIATYWKEYTLSLADSLPLTSLVFSFFLLFIMFISIRKASYQFKNRLSII